VFTWGTAAKECGETTHDQLYNPETVSTDFDTADVLNLFSGEQFTISSNMKARRVIVQLGGQTALKLGGEKLLNTV
jgi:hypothetical protein